MRIGVFSAELDVWHNRDLLRASEVVGIQLIPLDFRRVGTEVGGENAGRAGAAGRGALPDRERITSGETALEELDAILIRSVPGGTLEQVVYRMDLLHRLFAAGVPVVNPPGAIESTVDKYLASAKLAAAGLPVPRTAVAETLTLALSHFDDLGGDTVVKPLFGSGGRGMMRPGTREIAERTFRTLEQLGSVIYQQEFVEHPDGDLRVLVIGGKAVAAMERCSPREGPGAMDFRTNISRGGQAAAHETSPEEADLAIRAALAVGAEVAGVDLLPARDGRLLIAEVNSSPGWRALSQVSGIDVATLLLAHIIQRVKIQRVKA